MHNVKKQLFLFQTMRRNKKFGNYCISYSTELEPYNGSCILGPPILLEIYGLKLTVVLKWRDI